MNVKFRRLSLLIIAILLFSSILFAVAEANDVFDTRLDDQSIPTDYNQFAPPACSALNLVSMVVCPASGGACDGTDASELILGSPADDDIQAGKGDDCLLGGGGDDSMRGEQNTDVCIGGAGADTFHPSCETQIQ